MTFSELLDSFQGMPALVVGDLMLDRYQYCDATDVASDAPMMSLVRIATCWTPGEPK